MQHAFIRAIAVASVVASCAQTNRPTPEPVGRTHTTSAPLSNDSTPSYGTSDMDSWSDPAASGFATHGSATPGSTAATVETVKVRPLDAGLP